MGKQFFILLFADRMLEYVHGAHATFNFTFD